MIDVFPLSRKRTYHNLIIYLISLLTLTLVSCGKDQSDVTHISGKIINSKAKTVVFRDFQELNDTIQVDSTGHFKLQLNKIKPGLYTFLHSGEYQSIYLEPGDSIMMRFNTKAFDESLAFTGSHSQENNYMINLFIEMEQDNKFIRSQYYKEPSQFKKTMDSLTNRRINKLDKTATDKNFEETFYQALEKAIHLNAYSHLERYPYSHYGKRNILQSESLPTAFFAHREQVNLKDPYMLNNYAYRPYVQSLVANIALVNCAKKQGNGQLVDRNGYEYRHEKLNVIDSLFNSQEFKQQFASAEVRNFIRNSKNATEVNQLVSQFVSMSTSDSLNRNITSMAATYVNLNPGNKLPDFKLLNTSRDTTQISDQIEKLSVLFYWSNKDESYALRVHNKVRDLRGKYPEIEFIGINLDDPKNTLWQDANDRFKFNPNHEFQILNTESIISQLALRNNNRSMVVRPGLIIVDPSINLFHYKIETTLLGYLSL
ncbi:redoxin domain-containing protein [Nonlabens xiamenensis]|uniref:redoxin domain-containing protein n=1 Tax=Nonlabens xiamenensis TaxID=2341043 RepID=UPI000F607A96|nr:redoxin domain-containing protein [Nonlabens xiamenensis]